MLLNNLFTKYRSLLFILILSIFAIKPFFAPGFFTMHDDTQVSRVFEMGKALQDGMFPVRWSNDLGYGYGYPIFNFYAPLAYYIGGAFMLLHIDPLLATKIMMVIGILLSGVCMYSFAKTFWGELGGVISSLFYIYAPYHAVDIYVRGDVAEFCAYAFIPMVFLGLYKIYESVQTSNATDTNSKHSSNSIIGSIGIAGVILSHNLTAFMLSLFLLPFFILLIVFSKKKLLMTYYLLLTAIIGLFLSSFYWLPVLFEMKYTNVLSQVGGSADFHQHFVCISQFWFSQWGYGGSGPQCTDGISFMLGKLYIALPFFSLVGSVYFWEKKKLYALTMLVAFFGWIFALFLTTEFSKFIWEHFPVMSFLQYPWRFLLLAAFFSSFLAGSGIWILKQCIHKKIVVSAAAIVLILLLLFTQAKFFIPQTILPVSSNYYTNENTLHWKISKISDEYMPKNFYKPNAAQYTVRKTFQMTPIFGKVLADNEKTHIKSAKVINTFGIHVFNQNIAYFPAWHYYVDGAEEPTVMREGKLILMIPPGEHDLLVVFQQTYVERIGNILSLAGLIILILGIIILRRK